MSFSDDQLLRYSRQILLPQIDLAGQEKLLSAHLLIIGAGGLGAAAALYLAGAGIAVLSIIDDDEVDSSNLHRQVAYREVNVGQPKVMALQQQLQGLNPECQVKVYQQRADEAWLKPRVSEADAVLDCSDNFATRLSVNAACVKARVPLISAAAIRFEGQLAVFDLRQADAACYSCLYGAEEESTAERDTSCSESGIVGPLVGMMGNAQALEAIKLIVGLPIEQRLHVFDGLAFRWQSLLFRKDPGCPVCTASIT